MAEQDSTHAGGDSPIEATVEAHAEIPQPVREDSLDRVLNLVAPLESRSNSNPESHSPSEKSHIARTESVSQAAIERLGLRTAQLIEVKGKTAMIRLVGQETPLKSTIADFVDIVYLTEACNSNQLALVEICEHEILVVGVIQCQPMRHLKWEAEKIEINAKTELLLRSGRAALKLRSDGSVDLLGTRIAATSRGVLKLIGRALRLN